MTLRSHLGWIAVFSSALAAGCGGAETQTVNEVGQGLNVNSHRRCSFGPWATVDDYVVAGSAAASGVAVDVFNNVYVVGATATGSPAQWTVRKSSDAGATWSVVDTFFYGGSIGTNAIGVTGDASGDVFVTGTATLDLSGSGHWLVRRSTDGGGTWSTIDDYQHATGISGAARNAVVDSNGNLFVTGYSDNVETDGTRVYHWITRESANGGNTWSTSDDIALGRSSTGYANAADLQGNVYAVGYANDFSQLQWSARLLARNATTWTTTDTFSLAPAEQAIPSAMTVDDANTIYAGGFAWDSQGVSHGVVRISTDHGATWTTSDDFTNGITCQVRALTANIPAKTVFAGLKCSSPTGYHWITRSTNNHGASWSTVDDFQLAANHTTYVNGAGSSAAADSYVAGIANDAGGALHWIVRKSSCR